MVRKIDKNTEIDISLIPKRFEEEPVIICVCVISIVLINYSHHAVHVAKQYLCIQALHAILCPPPNFEVLGMTVCIVYVPVKER